MDNCQVTMLIMVLVFIGFVVWKQVLKRKEK